MKLTIDRPFTLDSLGELISEECGLVTSLGTRVKPVCLITLKLPLLEWKRVIPHPDPEYPRFPKLSQSASLSLSVSYCRRVCLRCSNIPHTLFIHIATV